MLDQESSYLTNKRAEAIKVMGKNHIGHPEYTLDPIHSLNPQVWWMARQPMVETIRKRAAEAAKQNASKGRNLFPTGATA